MQLKNCSTRRGISREDVDLYEINEAFASQSVACLRRLKLDERRVNPRGGALALGHPVGCSGARILVTLIHEMQDLDAQTGIASFCALAAAWAWPVWLKRCNKDRS